MLARRHDPRTMERWGLVNLVTTGSRTCDRVDGLGAPARCRPDACVSEYQAPRQSVLHAKALLLLMRSRSTPTIICGHRRTKSAG